MRILVFNDSLEMGGAEKVLIKLLNYLADEKKASVDLLLPDAGGDSVLLNEISKRVNISYIRKKPVGRLRRVLEENMMIFAPRIYRRFKGFDFSEYDRIICFKESFYACLFSKLKNRRILWIHTMLYKRIYKIDNAMESVAVWLNKRHIKRAQKAYKQYDRVVCVSEACKDSYLDVLLLKKGVQDVSVLHNAINVAEVRSLAEMEQVEMSESKVNFVHITRDSPDKRFDRVVSAAKRLASEGYDFHIYVIGDVNPNIEILLEYSDQNTEDYFSFLGQLKNPYPYVSKADWLLCSSERESFSLVLIEALALHTAVITTDCGGPSEIVDGGKYGLLVSNSTEGVLDGMRQVLKNNELMRVYEDRCSEALERFDNERWYGNASRILDLI